MKLKYCTLYIFGFWMYCGAMFAQEKIEPIPFGDFDQWVVRKIKESAIIGKEVKTLYAVGPTETITENKPYEPKGGSPWGCSNVMAKVSGITKASSSVYPEDRENGQCARLETLIESCSAMGFVNIKVLVGGCLYLGKFLEPAKNSSETWGQIVCGIPFHKKPSSLHFDYKVLLSGEPNRIKLSGFSKRSEVAGKDMPVVNLYLQKRWEDKHGNIYAKRIGTLVVQMDKNTDWVNNASFPILYGDITKRSDYQPFMGLLKGEAQRFSKNSKGKNVPIQEIGWGSESDEVTHIILEFCSSYGGSYIGSPGTKFWVDNVQLGYDQ